MADVVTTLIHRTKKGYRYFIRNHRRSVFGSFILNVYKLISFK